MTMGVDPHTKSSLRKEQTPQLTILDTFRAGVTAALQEAESGEEVWLEVLSDYCRRPELYPGGPQGRITGSFGKRDQGVLFQPDDILQSWSDLGIKSFWYTLIGVERVHYTSPKRIVKGVETLKRYPHLKIDAGVKKWLVIAGCIDDDCLNGRWDIIKELFNHSMGYLDSDDIRLLTIFSQVSSGLEARKMFYVDGDSLTYERVFKRFRDRNWLVLTKKASRDSLYKVSDAGIKVLNTGKWIKQAN